MQNCGKRRGNIVDGYFARIRPGLDIVPHEDERYVRVVIVRGAVRGAAGFKKIIRLGKNVEISGALREEAFADGISDHVFLHAPLIEILPGIHARYVGLTAGGIGGHARGRMLRGFSEINACQSDVYPGVQPRQAAFCRHFTQ